MSQNQTPKRFIIRVGFTGTKQTVSIDVNAYSKQSVYDEIYKTLNSRSTHMFRQFDGSNVILNLDNITFILVEEV